MFFLMPEEQKYSIHNIISKILIVAPKNDDRNFFKSILSFHFKIETTSNGCSALNILSEDPEFNIVITSNLLHDLPSQEFLLSLKKDFPWIGIIVFDSNGKGKDMLLPEIPFLFKPVKTDILFKTVREILEKQEENNPSGIIRKSGRKISGYNILETIGMGNIGKVVLVEKEGKKYAMKTLQVKHLSQCRAQKERFNREAKLLIDLNHPNLIKVFEHYSGNPACIVMEYIKGKPLNDYIKNQSLSFEQNLSIIGELVTVLDFIHKRGIIHRDIKPENIMVTEDLRIKLTDFGIAGVHDSDLTLTGEVIGSPCFMAPETFESLKNINEQADIFSLGVVFYALLTGELPFKGDSVVEIMEAICHSEPVPPSKLNTELPLNLEKILNKMLAKARETRYRRATEIIQDLQSL